MKYIIREWLYQEQYRHEGVDHFKYLRSGKETRCKHYQTTEVKARAKQFKTLAEAEAMVATLCKRINEPNEYYEIVAVS